MKTRILISTIFVLAFGASTAYAQDASVLPESLVRLSWGAVIAGVIIGLVTQMSLNILGLAAGMTSINPEVGKESADAETLGTSAIVWISISSLLAWFFGGWLAARFAGTPNELDGVLHGVLVWSLATLVTFVMLSTSIGRLLSGLSSVTSQILQLAGQAVGTTAQVAGQAVQTTASTAGAAVSNTAQATANAAGSAANAAASAAGSTANAATDAAQEAMPSQTDMRQLTREYDLSKDKVRNELRAILRDADVPPEEIENRVEALGNAVRNDVKQALRNPSEADEYIQQAFERVIGEANTTIERVDRDNVVRLLTVRTGMSAQEAHETVMKWEGQIEQASRQLQDAQRHAQQQMRINSAGTEGAMDAAQEYAAGQAARIQQTTEDVQQQAQELQREAKAKAQTLQREAEAKAREAAQETTDTIAKLAAALFVSLAIGLGAASFGGFLGTPEELPVADVDTASIDGFSEVVND